jgi:hypothetical protein
VLVKRLHFRVWIVCGFILLNGFYFADALAQGRSGESPGRPVQQERTHHVGAMHDPVFRQERIAAHQAAHTNAMERARVWAGANNAPMRIETNDTIMVLVDYTEELGPLYRSTLNVNAAISTAADLVNATPYGLTGAGIVAGIWDGGNVRDTHTEFSGRVTNFDSAGLSAHATHVAGTMIARGASSSARGMATNATLFGYDFNNDLAEMTGRAMADPENPEGTVQISNHSYGYIAGWATGNWSGTSAPHWFGTWGAQESDFFGLYISYDRDLDQLLYDSLYYLPVVSAGNDRTDAAPSNGTTFYYRNNLGNWVSATYDSSIHPLADFQKGGYDTIPFGSMSKNILLVGAVNDAVTSGLRDVSKATQSTFSSWGPTDDGRIKPDVVGNGVSLTSSGSSSDTHYYISSGTSMSAPNVSGSALLLLEYHDQLYPGEYLLASTLKALILHTADSLDAPGPDYRNGWGLMNTKAAVDHMTVHYDAPALGVIVEEVLPNAVALEYEVLWDAESDLWATLVWTDPPGPARSGLNNTNLALINDLDLRIITPSGSTNFPWVLDPANPANAATTGDNFRDNVEQVYLAAPEEEGVYTIRISHKGSLTNNEQIFSLLVSGITDTVPLRLEGDLAYGSVQVDTSVQRNLTIHNDNVFSVAVTNVALPAGFTTSWTGSIDAGRSRDVPITFSPIDTISYGTNLLIYTATFDDPAAHPLAGAGVDALLLGITDPAENIAVANSNSTFTIAGVAGSALAGVLSWSNPDASASGTVSVGTDWSITDIPLIVGTNTLSVSATNNPSAQVVATNSAAGATWATGDNGGNGFNAWILETSGANAGHFIGGNGWGLYANSGDEANAYRPLGQPLHVGDRLSFRFQNNWVQNGGTVGVGLLNGDGEEVLALFFVGGEARYRINDMTANRDTGVDYATTGFPVVFTLTGVDTYELDINGTLITGTLASAGSMEITRFRAWNFNGGSGSNYDFFIDHLVQTQVAGAVFEVSDQVEIVRLGPPPEMTPIPAQEITVGETLNYTVEATGQGPISYDVSTAVPTARWTLNAETGAFTFTPTREDAGMVTFDFTAANDNDTSPPETMTVTVLAEPEFTAIGSQAADTGEPMSFSVSATGYPAPELELTGTTASGGFEFAPASGLLTYTPPYADVGTRTFTFTAANSLGAVTQVVDVVVSLTPPAPPVLWVASTNAVEIVAEWTASEGATEYRLDVHTHPEFLNEIPGAAGFEDFEGIGTGTFATRVWTNNGVVWTGVQASADQTITGKAIGLQNNAGYFESQPIAGGVESLSIDYKRASGGPPASFNLLINGTNRSTTQYNTSVETLSLTNLSIDGSFVIRIENAGNTVGVFDNLTWTNSAVPGGVYVEGYSNHMVAATSEPVSGLEPGNLYYLRVRAVNDAGASAYSDTVSVTTLLEMVRILSAAQTATDGTGGVTIELESFHPDAEAIDIEVLYSDDDGLTWTNAWLASATAGVLTEGVLQGVSVREGGEQITNMVELIWSSTNAPALAGATGTLVRARGWDGAEWSDVSVSEPFLVDNIAPDPTGAWIEIPTSDLGAYTFATVLTNTWGGFLDSLSGIAGYYIAFADGGGTDAGTWATSSPFALTPPELDADYVVYVWAQDQKGNIGLAVNRAITVLSEEGDYDGGGMSNREKEIAGVSAIDPEAVFATEAESDQSATPTLRWPWAAGRTYTVAWSDGPLGTGVIWNEIALESADYDVVDGVATWTDPAPLNGAPRYYRLRVQLAD